MKNFPASALFGMMVSMMIARVARQSRRSPAQSCGIKRLRETVSVAGEGQQHEATFLELKTGDALKAMDEAFVTWDITKLGCRRTIVPFLLSERAFRSLQGTNIHPGRF